MAGSGLKLGTSRIGYSGPYRVDVTVKSGIGLVEVLRPTWEIVSGHKLNSAIAEGRKDEIARWSKHGTVALDDEGYTREYVRLMLERYDAERAAFVALL